jgi:hypothetical protein
MHGASNRGKKKTQTLTKTKNPQKMQNTTGFNSAGIAIEKKK